MKCHRCGTENAADVQICKSCGGILASESSAPQSSEQPPDEEYNPFEAPRSQEFEHRFQPEAGSNGLCSTA